MSDVRWEECKVSTMSIVPILTKERVDQMRKAGYWRDRVLTDFLDKWANETPDAIAIVDPAHGLNITYRDLRSRSDRIAQNLAAVGIEHGDVVSFQLPNWWHITALHLACLRIGAISNPLMPAMRQRELSFILGRAESKLLIAPRSFRGFDFQAMIESLLPSLPKLRHFIVVDDAGGKSGRPTFDDALMGEPRDRPRMRPAAPDDIMQLLFTSGTTGEPKGVLHTSNTLVSHMIASAERLQLTARDTALTATPMTHQMGFLFGLIMPIVLGAKSVLEDAWNPDIALRLIKQENATYSMGATPFFADMADHPNASLASGRLKMFLTGGAPIPPELARHAKSRLGARIMPMWGMTENGAVTLTKPEDSDERILSSDGSPMPGMEIAVFDAAGQKLGPNQEGHLKCRGPNNFVGYLNRPDLYDVDSEGWFATGDLARIDPHGYVRITGRAKDMIIRGGENIPVVEIEGVLIRHPSIERVALVAMPDPRLGERACAFVIVREGSTFDIAEMRRFLAEQNMMRNYWPERVEVVEAMPTTESGKIQKMKLREIAKHLTPQ